MLSDDLVTTSLYPAVERAVGLVALPISVPLSYGVDTQHEPINENWYHGGLRGNLRKSSNRKRLSQAIEVIIPIDEEVARTFHALNIKSEAVT